MEIITDIHVGDSKKELKLLSENSVDLVVTSPPYADQRKNTSTPRKQSQFKANSNPKTFLQPIKSVTTLKWEAGDPRFYGVQNAKGESLLLYHIKKLLNTMGYDFIKKRMHKDGHLVDECQQYLRARDLKKAKDGIYCIYNNRWQIEGAEEILNSTGQVKLKIERTDMFEESIDNRLYTLGRTKRDV